ncbi:MAG: PaaI family thioesterase [Chloroflexota bacterium]
MELLGLHLDKIAEDEVTGWLVVDPGRHFHPWGAVHGGLYCTVVETLATLGAAARALPAGKLAVGVENHTSFLRPVKEGRLSARAVPLSRGRQLHLWEVRITDDHDRLVAHGTVRLALIEGGDSRETRSPAEG